MSSIFFILGAGASRDSGIQTYRGPDGFYTDKDEDPSDILNPFVLKNDPQKVWDFLYPFYQQIEAVKDKPGPTYQIIKKIADDDGFEGSCIMTQNVDGLALTTGLQTIEIHGNARNMYCEECGKVEKINYENLYCDCTDTKKHCYRPEVVLFNEALPRYELERVYRFIKTRPKYILIIGTTLQFPYLRELIKRAKRYGGKVVHINPDDKYKSNIQKNEEWIQENADIGLEIFLKKFNENTSESDSAI